MVSICGRVLGGRPPSPQLAGSDVEEDELGAGSSGGEFWFLSWLFLFAVMMHRAKMATSLHRLQSGDGWQSWTCTGQCGVGKVLGGEVVPIDAAEERVFCVDRGASAPWPAGVAAEGMRVTRQV